MGFSSEAAKQFFCISGTTVFLGLLNTWVFLVIRAEISEIKKFEGVGFFDAAWRLSMMYVLLILGSFGTYYLPRLSAYKSKDDRNKLISQVYQLTNILIVPIVIVVISFKPLVIEMLYSPAYLPTLEIMRWMLIGDYFKVTAWVVSMPALAYADMKVYFFSETLWNLGFLGFTLYSLKVVEQLQWIGVGFLLMYVVYMIFYHFYTYYKYAFVVRPSLIVRWLSGLAIIMGVSYITWNDLQTRWLLGIILAFLSLIYTLLIINSDQRAKLIHYVTSLHIHKVP